MATENIDIDYTKYDFKDSTEMYVHLSKKGLSKDTVIEISKMKNEPQWMLDFRIRSYEVFMEKPMPTWGGDLSVIDFQNIYYYAKASDKTEKNWDDNIIGNDHWPRQHACHIHSSLAQNRIECGISKIKQQCY